MVAYTKPQPGKKEEIERLKGERDQIKFIALRFERWQVVRFSELCRGKAMVAYTKPQPGKKEEIERLKGERDQIEFIAPRFERWQVLRFRKARRRQDVPKIAYLHEMQGIWSRGKKNCP